MKKKLSKTEKECIRILRNATELIKKGWTRHALAVNKRGEAVVEISQEACKFCALGALRRATSDLKKPWALYCNLRFFVEKHIEEASLSLFNDHQKSKWPVIELFEKTIAQIARKEFSEETDY